MPDIAVTVSPILPTMAVALAEVTTSPATFAPAVPGADPYSFAVAARFAEIAADETAKAQARANLDLQVIDLGTFN